MKPLFTIHEGEFLVGDYINRQPTHKFEVWVPTKDSGVDLLVTRKRGQGKALGLQVKFSRSFGVREELADHLIATSWFTLDPVKVRKSPAELWVFVILTLRHETHFIVIPTRELRKRIPPRSGRKWNLYFWVLKDKKTKTCYQVRGLKPEVTRAIPQDGVQDRHRDFSKWLEGWNLLDELTRKSR